MASPVMRNSTMKSHYESVERVIEAMHNRIGEPLSLGSMAKIAFASRYHFNRTFRKVTGVPPAQFLYALRLERAKRLLLQTQRKVIDICYEVGYNSVGTFTRRFTDLLGVSPVTLRQLARSPIKHVRPYHPALVPADRKSNQGCSISGRVRVPAGFNGLIFVGLFQDPIPQGQPLACAAPSADGSYSIADAPEGEFYLFALGVAHPIQSPECFNYESALRGGGHLLRISRDSVQGSTYLRLRPPSPFDPPILLVLPVLMEKFFNQQRPAKDELSFPPPPATIQARLGRPA